MATDMHVTLDIRPLLKLPGQVGHNISAFLDSEAEQVVNGIKQSIGQVSYGRRYVRKNSVHIASRKGDPPNVDTGRLWNSYRWIPVNANTRRIETDVEYAVHLEFGTSKMQPRPHVGPEMERLRARIGRDAANFRLVK